MVKLIVYINKSTDLTLLGLAVDAGAAFIEFLKKIRSYGFQFRTNFALNFLSAFDFNLYFLQTVHIESSFLLSVLIS